MHCCLTLFCLRSILAEDAESVQINARLDLWWAAENHCICNLILWFPCVFLCFHPFLLLDRRPPERAAGADQREAGPGAADRGPARWGPAGRERPAGSISQTPSRAALFKRGEPAGKGWLDQSKNTDSNYQHIFHLFSATFTATNFAHIIRIQYTDEAVFSSTSVDNLNVLTELPTYCTFNVLQNLQCWIQWQMCVRPQLLA